MERSEFLQKVQSTIEENNLFTKEDSILVGVSGGVDSMTLIQSLFELGYSVAIAHCNFKLRDAESDGDQDFVVKYANSKNIPIHVCSFDTKNVAQERKISIEMAARDLRYEWFDTVCHLNGYTKLAIAHNQNDSVETFFINLLRSAGIKGLTGIPMKNGSIVRPLLNVSRAEIEDFARQSSLSFRVDSTNLGNDYMRNKIRNIILPELQAITPHCLDSISTSMAHMQEAYSIYIQSIGEKKASCSVEKENGFVIDEEKLLQQENSQTILYEFLHPCGFNSDVISQVYNSLEKQSGKKFESENYVVVHDRNSLIAEKKTTNVEQQEFEISDLMQSYQLRDFSIDCQLVSKENFSIIKSSDVASLDFDKLQFPLRIRTWQSGDSFVPFGMNGRKKVSDFLIDTKVSLLEKQKVCVLESAGKIAWVIGYRISQEFAVNANTKTVAVLKMQNL